MITVLQTLGMLALTLGIVVTVHEFGHFWVARRCGVKVLKFSVGFGRAIWSRTARDGVEYSIGMLPLGGYVKMVDERETPVEGALKEQAFNNRPVSQRIAIAAAGPLANFLLAIVIYFCLFWAGERGLAPVIGAVTPGSLAEMAALEAGQEIVAIDGVDTPTWQSVNFRLLERLGDTGYLELAATYPPSERIYNSSVYLNRWLVGEEEPQLIQAFGIAPIRPDIVPIVGSVLDDGAAQAAGVQVGDQITAIDGQPIALWDELVDVIRDRPDERLVLSLLRDGVPIELTVVVGRALSDGVSYGQLGIGVQPPAWPEDMIRTIDRGPVEALGAALARTSELISFTLESLRKMLEGLISPKNLSGPITIAKVATATAESGFESYFGFIALLSVSLGVLNLLPIPVLDGGHIMYYVIEWVSGRPVSERVQIIGYQIGLFLVSCLMVFALYNDVARL